MQRKVNSNEHYKNVIKFLLRVINRLVLRVQDELYALRVCSTLYADAFLLNALIILFNKAVRNRRQTVSCVAINFFHKVEEGDCAFETIPYSCLTSRLLASKEA